ncbi:electron transport complex protein RnfG [Anaerotaenia torta]|uniref:FMN-binding protein n=1 Tax=Anaerotaenia torta TaxID=433293 RepID=UPI003D19EFA9
MFKSVIKQALFLFTTTVIIAGLLGIVHYITEEPIQAQLERELLLSKQILLPAAATFETVDITNNNISSVKMVERGLDASGSKVGYVVTVTPKGYGGEILTMVGFDASISITSYRILKSNETPGLGDIAAKPDFISRFEGRSGYPINIVKLPAKETDVQAITGATITSKAIAQGINHAAEIVTFIEEENNEQS